MIEMPEDMQYICHGYTLAVMVHTRAQERERERERDRGGGWGEGGREGEEILDPTTNS